MRPTFELADVLRLGLEDYEQHYRLSEVQRKAANAIQNCRTAVLGGHVEACSTCGAVSISYNSCRHRACPKCQWAAQVRWVEQRSEELLNTQYFHVVFTVPHDLNPLFLSNDVRLYNLLFRCAWETLDQLARQQQWLGAQTGMLAVLHTWGQKLDFHPHVHCIVPGGGVTKNGSWTNAKKGFFVPVKVLSTLFRAKFLAALKQLYLQDKLSFFGTAEDLEGKDAFMRLLKMQYRSNWVVYAKAPMSGPMQVLRYLGRYSHRIAISNRRILNVQAGKVTFAYKDRRDSDRNKTLTLDTREFIRRFLLHVLPHGFHKIRYFGMLAIRNRKSKLLEAKKQLAPILVELRKNDADPPQEITYTKPPCSVCGGSTWNYVETLPSKLFKATAQLIAARPPPENRPLQIKC